MCPKRKPIGVVLVIKVTVSFEILYVMMHMVGLDFPQHQQMEFRNSSVKQ